MLFVAVIFTLNMMSHQNVWSQTHDTLRQGVLEKVPLKKDVILHLVLTCISSTKFMCIIKHPIVLFP